MKNTALITGASNGIGLELAKIHAANGDDLILVARSVDKLKELKNKLEKEYKIKVHAIAKDLSDINSGKEVYNEVKENNIQVTVLINNAGFGDFGMFAESNWEKQMQMINLNITTLTYLTRLFLPDFITQKNGRIMNIASTAAFQPGPTMAVYYATKAYVLSFSEAIANELEGTGITVTVLCPGATESGFQAAAALEESKLVKGKKLPSSKEVAEYGYQKMMNGNVVAIHGLMNTIMATSIRFTPRPIVRKIVRYMQDTAN